MASAGSGEDGNFSVQFPAPPPFWKQFTPENLLQVKQLQEKNEPVPESLNFLVPPPVPESGKYASFGGAYDVHELLPSLEKQDQEQVYPKTEDGQHVTEDRDWTIDRAFNLKQIVRSILMNYLELIATIAEDPTKAEVKIQHITTLLLNAHHLINEYRPHQAREAVIESMEQRIAKIKAEIEAVKQMKAKVEALPATLPTATEDVPDLEGKSDVKKSPKSLEDSVLAELKDEFGV